ncbi:MAG: saccharopine dehydrogenase NADP-binding domain-containing protein [Cyclobacteriaceae bacterium]|nr:saccharopine dehydrogenase NADP-binding domain-containing protein [Cyclobacteriaceae bacterium]
MKHILVLGAGRSSSALITYLAQYCHTHGHRLTVGDAQRALVQERATPPAEAIAFDIHDPASEEVLRTAHVVISLLPAFLHPMVARLCLKHGIHLLTASYVSDEIKAMHAEAARQGLLFLNECGLDPGLDHLSAMQLIHGIQKKGGTVFSFESFTGGLIAPTTDPDNPWRYKFTWNPRNVVLAGQGTARFLQQGRFKYIPYQQLFQRTVPVTIPGYGNFEGYANRDSLKYQTVYGLTQVDTLLRGTLRNEGYCAAWNVLVQLGCCDDTYLLEHTRSMTPADFIQSFLPGEGAVERLLCHHLGLAPEGGELARLRWSGFFGQEPIGLPEGTPARLTEHILNTRWQLQPHDKDLVVMWHRVRYRLEDAVCTVNAYLTAEGENADRTAMAKTVGLPLAMAARLLLENKLHARGVIIPVTAEYYDPILRELQLFGIALHEQEG